MEFDTHSQSAAFHSPLADFEEVTETVDVREDPSLVKKIMRW